MAPEPARARKTRTAAQSGRIAGPRSARESLPALSSAPHGIARPLGPAAARLGRPRVYEDVIRVLRDFFRRTHPGPPPPSPPWAFSALNPVAQVMVKQMLFSRSLRAHPHSQPRLRRLHTHARRNVALAYPRKLSKIC